MKNEQKDALGELLSYAITHILPKESQEIPLPAGLAFLQSEWKGKTVWMKSASWTHPRYRLIRYTRLFSEGRISTFNWVFYPKHFSDAPIFASDIVIGADKMRVAVMDAMPLFPSEEVYYTQWIEPFAPLYQESLAIAPPFERKLSWSTKFLGENACLATGLNTGEISPIIDLWKKYVHLYLSLTTHLTVVNEKRQNAVSDWHKNYNREHLAVENQRNPYMVYFGKELGERYNREFLFANDFGG